MTRNDQNKENKASLVACENGCIHPKRWGRESFLSIFSCLKVMPLGKNKGALLPA